MSDRSWPNGAYLAEFDDAGALVAAARALRKAGYTQVESYTPYPVPELPELLGHRGSRLPMIVFLAGCSGAGASYAIQWFANVISYPLNIGGRPAHAVPAFFIPTFEGTVLAAAIAAFVGLLVILRLPQPWHPIFEIDGFERATIDRFWLAIDLRDPAAPAEDLRNALDATDPIRVVELEPQR